MRPKIFDYPWLPLIGAVAIPYFAKKGNWTMVAFDVAALVASELLFRNYDKLFGPDDPAS